ncbi:murein biosynthesis integral membrane protein MurJ [Occultella aeris]|uniref:Putative peptidoglycan biosynthesis protein MviN n=1 Tax=Occultella aeris TaxID=2761496 RepID=A0A7M4DR74_9MICO|nr:lipid II flippase MurJ [Occultella aeris]VZO39968.1 putative peptidoglycan biosynthesis protein MviN [Occultella aeris]
MSSRRLLGGVAGAATMIAVLTVASRLVGFGRWWVQAKTVGATAVGNAYATANTVPNVLYEVVAGGALAGAVIPLLAAPLARKIQADVDRISSALLTWAMLALIPIALALTLLARPIAEALPQSVGGNPAAQEDLTTFFLIVFAPQVVLYGIGVVLTGVLQAHRRFLAPALAPLVSSTVVILSYVAFGALADGMQDQPGQLSDAALAWLAWGTTAGVAVLSLPLLIPVRRCGVRLRPTLRFPPGVARRAGALALAGIGSLVAQQVSVLAVVLLARKGGAEGTINVFQWTQAVYLLPYAVLAIPLATAVFPRLAELASNGHRDQFARTADGSTRAVLAVSMLGMAALLAVAPAAEAVFALGNDTAGMTLALTLMAPGVVGLAMIFHVGRALFALDRQRVAVAATAGGWLVVTVACAVGVRVVAPDGGAPAATLAVLGLGHSIGMTVAGLALLVAFARALPGSVTRATARTVLVCGGGAVVGSLVGRWATDAVLDLAGRSGLAAVMAGLLGAILAAAAVCGAVFAADRDILSILRRTRA